MPIVRGRRQKQTMLKAPGQVADGLGEARLDPVATTGGWGGVVRLIEDEQAPRRERAEPLAQRIGVGRVAQQVVGDQKAAMGAPGIDAEAAFAAHTGQVSAVEQHKDQPKALLKLRLPLLQHRGRRGHDDGTHLLAKQQLTHDQGRLNRLAEAGIIGDKEIDARQQQRLPQRLHLIGVNLNPGAEGRLKQGRIGRSHTIPAQRMQKSGEARRRIEPTGGEVGPTLRVQNLPIQLIVPEHLQHLALGVIISTSEAHPRSLTGHGRRDDLIDQPSTGAHMHELTDLGRVQGQIGIRHAGAPAYSAANPAARRRHDRPRSHPYARRAGSTARWR